MVYNQDIRFFTFDNDNRVREMVVLGVTLTDTLSFRPHVNRIVARTAQTSYALRLLQSHGLGAHSYSMLQEPHLLHSSPTQYASPAWTGFINCEDKARLQGVLKKLQRSGFLPTTFKHLKKYVKLLMLNYSAPSYIMMTMYCISCSLLLKLTHITCVSEHMTLSFQM